MAQIYVSIGSNIEPLLHIRAAIADMRHYFGPLTLSSVYESEAIGFVGDNFYNLVAGFNTKQEIHAVAQLLRQIEQKNGRQRTTVKFNARTLDLDILLYDQIILTNDTLTVPRDEILKYAFVLFPLAEIAPTLKHPITGQTYAEIAQQFDNTKQPLWRVDLMVNNEPFTIHHS
jgi:2-amino-4-hydroxy-6-hydroxymethyldihydropteridine diphosphokinase